MKEIKESLAKMGSMQDELMDGIDMVPRKSAGCRHGERETKIEYSIDTLGKCVCCREKSERVIVTMLDEDFDHSWSTPCVDCIEAISDDFMQMMTHLKKRQISKIK